MTNDFDKKAFIRHQKGAIGPVAVGQVEEAELLWQFSHLRNAWSKKLTVTSASFTPGSFDYQTVLKLFLSADDANCVTSSRRRSAQSD